MDPFTQRMLERARLRREKLDSQHISAGQEAPIHVRVPLQEKNQTHLVKITTEEVSCSKPCDWEPTSKVSHVKEQCDSVIEEDGGEAEEDQPVESDDGETMENNGLLSQEEEEEEEEKELKHSIRNDVRSQLKRLGALYSDSPSQLSSPIHRTEETFFSDISSRPARKTPASSRLAALANTINQWEDDMSHPAPRAKNVQVTTCSTKVVRTCSVVKMQPKITQPEKKIVKETSPIKKIILDNKLISTLESSEDPSALNSITQEKNVSSPQSSPTKLPSLSRKPDITPTSSAGNSPKKTWTPPVQSPTKLRSSNVSSPKMGLESVHSTPGSPEKKFHSPARNPPPLRVVSDRSPAVNSVLHKTQMFESCSPNVKKDPTELSVSERLALFERNKGEALVPKVPFSMSVPIKYLDKSDSKSNITKSTSKTNVRSPVQKGAVTSNNVGVNINKVLAQRQLFESGQASVAHQTIAQNIQSERQKEMEMLLNRWNKHKNVTESEEKPAPVAQYTPRVESRQAEPKFPAVSTPPPPPPMPSKDDTSPVKVPLPARQPSPVKVPPPARQPSPVKVPPPARQSSPMKQPTYQLSPQKSVSQSSPVKQPSSQPSPQKSSLQAQYPALADVKKIKVSPPKPGKLYPCLSDMEATTETESEMPEEDRHSDSYSSSNEEMESSLDASDTSFGREILQAVSRHTTPLKRDNSGNSVTPSKLAVLEDMDLYLKEAIDDSSTDSDGPTPPKKTRCRSRSPQKSDKFRSPTTAPSHSFKYSRGEDYCSPRTQELPTHVVEEGQQVPLMHTVSFYRRQQNMSPKKPSRLVTRKPESETSDTSQQQPLRTDPDAVRERISFLLDEINKHQTIISQASQALNLCSSTVEFSGSAESVEGERLLLLATQRRQAALNEIQRLKVECSLKPISQGGQHVGLTEKGSLTTTGITLPLKKEYIRSIINDDTTHYFMCLLKSQEQVLSTPVQAASRENLRDSVNLVFTTPLKLADLYSDFKVLLEVYTLKAPKEILPHDIKYHITKKDGKKMTPKKKNESRLLRTPVQSPAGPSAVRSPLFQLAGYVMFSLQELHRTRFTLNKVAYTSPLVGHVELQLESQLCVDVVERGFLTMFEDISGFGAWHRRWCVLKGPTLSYWKYPDDEKKKVPIGCIDLNRCSTEVVGLVSRDICARPNTFLLETRRPPQSEDQDSLITVCHQTHTTIRHLLSADTREERVMWCTQFNKALSMLRAWSNKKRSD